MAKTAKIVAPSIETPETDTVPIAQVTFPDGSDATNNEPVTFETYREKAREHGRSRAIGDDSVAMLAIDICNGAKIGKIDPRTVTEKTKANEADPRDDIELLFGDYVEARGLKAIHERKGNSVANKATQLRKFAHLGKLKDVDGPAILDDVVARYKSTYAMSNEDQRELLDSALAVYHRAALLQCENPKKALTDDQIGSCLNKRVSAKARNISTEWDKIANAAKSLTDGTRKLKDGSVIEDKSEAGAKLALAIVAYAKALSDEIALADLKAKTATIEAQMMARNGVAAPQENIPA